MPQSDDGPGLSTPPLSTLPLITPRLILRPRCSDDAPVMRALWTERDLRVPSHRRIDAEGRPSVDDIREQLRTEASGGTSGLLAVVERATGEVIGYCGLVESDCGGPGEPEIAFELLRRTHGRGYATEAARAVVEQAREHGHRRLWATVWDWNTASRRVLEKLGFVEVGEPTPVPGRGRNLLTCLYLEPALPAPRQLPEGGAHPTSDRHPELLPQPRGTGIADS